MPSATTMKRLTIIAPHAGTTFTLGLLPGNGDAALRNAVAGRVRTPPTYHDGSDSFFLTDGSDPIRDVVVALSADLPDGLTLTMHMHKPPPILDYGNQPLLWHANEEQKLLAALREVSAPAPPPDPEPPAAAVEPPAAAEPPATEPPRPRALKRQQTSPSDVVLVNTMAKKLQAVYRGMQARTKAKELVAMARARWGPLVFIVDLWELLREELVQKFGVWLPGFISNYDRIPEQEREKQNEALYGMERMSRLSTDLANERTLLAYVRTILAIMRTAFVTMGIVGLGAFWEVVQKFTVFLTLMTMVTCAIIGIYRYYRIARIVSLKNIPASFGRNRVPMWPFIGFLISSVSVVFLGSVLQGFENP